MSFMCHLEISTAMDSTNGNWKGLSSTVTVAPRAYDIVSPVIAATTPGLPIGTEESISYAQVVFVTMDDLEEIPVNKIVSMYVSLCMCKSWFGLY